VWGSKPLWVLPQTSTIASHLPKALGTALAIESGKRLGHELPIPADSIVLCSFGDASANHATAQTAFNTAMWSAYQKLPAPVLFVCEDNGLGISVKTPDGWIAERFSRQPGLDYFYADGLDLATGHAQVQAAVEHCRRTRRPTFLHLRTTRLMGHAGTDFEVEWRALPELCAAEAQDPLLRSAQIALESGWMDAAAIEVAYETMRARCMAAAADAEGRPKLQSLRDVMAPLAPYTPAAVQAEARREVPAGTREALMAVRGCPDGSRHGTSRSRSTMPARNCWQVSAEPAVRRGRRAEGRRLHGHQGPAAPLRPAGCSTPAGRDHDPGHGPGPGQHGHAADSGNPVPGLSAQRHRPGARRSVFAAVLLQRPVPQPDAGAGGRPGLPEGLRRPLPQRQLDHRAARHPGLVVGCPSRGDDAVMMLRTLAALARVDGRVAVFLEPIALYMSKDLHEAGDGQWLFDYPAQGQALVPGEGRVYAPRPDDLVIFTYGNGVPMALRAARDRAAAGLAGAGGRPALAGAAGRLHRRPGRQRGGCWCWTKAATAAGWARAWSPRWSRPASATCRCAGSAVPIPTRWRGSNVRASKRQCGDWRRP
jgi:2-oxoisovalerate dehydrogenase E1 component